MRWEPKNERGKEGRAHIRGWPGQLGLMKGKKGEGGRIREIAEFATSSSVYELPGRGLIHIKVAESCNRCVCVFLPVFYRKTHLLYPFLVYSYYPISSLSDIPTWQWKCLRRAPKARSTLLGRCRGKGSKNRPLQTGNRRAEKHWLNCVLISGAPRKNPTEYFSFSVSACTLRVLK